MEKEIILFGAGNYAKLFYKDFHEILNIKYCVSNDSKENIFLVDGREICPVFRVDSIVLQKKQIIILCAEHYQEMEIQLRNMGYRNGVHYINSNTVRVLLSEKKIALCYGVCYLRAIYNCLKESKTFSEKYEAFYWLDYRQMAPEEYEFFSFLLPLCDLFIYNVFFSFEQQKRNQAYLQRLSRKCVVVSIPLITFHGYHPRTEGFVGEENPYNIVSIKSYFGTFLVPDPNINRLIEQGKTCHDIVNIIGDIGFYKKAWVEKNYICEMKRMELAERLADIKIVDFLKKNHGKERLFLNETHITNLVVIELAERILAHIGIVASLPKNELKAKRLLYTTEIPLYPSVIEHLGLEIYMNNPQYRLFVFDNEIDISFEEYVERYYEYCLSMKKWIEMGYFPR